MWGGGGGESEFLGGNRNKADLIKGGIKFDRNIVRGNGVMNLSGGNTFFDNLNVYYHSFSGPNECLARLQMELCRAANIFAAR